jgi:hypothetical protein
MYMAKGIVFQLKNNSSTKSMTYLKFHLPVYNFQMTSINLGNNPPKKLQPKEVGYNLIGK